MQSLSRQINILTQGRLDMDSFKLDDAVHLQPVVAGEIGVTRPRDDGMTDTVVIAKADKTCGQVLPNVCRHSTVDCDSGSRKHRGCWHGFHNQLQGFDGFGESSTNTTASPST